MGSTTTSSTDGPGASTVGDVEASTTDGARASTAGGAVLLGPALSTLRQEDGG